MKLNEKLKMILLVLVIVLISIIGFVGVYVQNKNAINNVLPEYKLGMDLNGYRRIELRMSDEKTTIKYDKDGNVIPSNDITTEVASSEEKSVNDDSVKNEENYKKVKQIIKQRLDAIGVEQYYIRQANDSENIMIQIPENDNTDSVVGQLQLQGKFEIVDDETNEVLMTNDDIEKVQAGYGSTENGTSVFLSIQFNKEGKEKFKNITNTYTETVEKEEGSDKEKTVEKEIAIKIDDSELLSTHFDTEISNGLLQLTVGSSKNSTVEELQESYIQANSMAGLLDSGKMPIKYEVHQNKYIQNNITDLDKIVLVCVAVSILVIIMVFMAVKFKLNGIFASLSLIGYTSLLTIVLRYTNVDLSIEGIAAFVMAILVEIAFLLNVLKTKKDEFWNMYIKFVWILVPMAIVSVIFALITKILTVSSFGMVIFWGLVTKFVWNAIITKNILNLKK